MKKLETLMDYVCAIMEIIFYVFMVGVTIYGAIDLKRIFVSLLLILSSFVWLTLAVTESYKLCLNIKFGIKNKEDSDGPEDTTD